MEVIHCSIERLNSVKAAAKEYKSNMRKAFKALKSATDVLKQKNSVNEIAEADEMIKKLGEMLKPLIGATEGGESEDEIMKFVKEIEKYVETIENIQEALNSL